MKNSIKYTFFSLLAIAIGAAACGDLDTQLAETSTAVMMGEGPEADEQSDVPENNTGIETSDDDTGTDASEDDTGTEMPEDVPPVGDDKICCACVFQPQPACQGEPTPSSCSSAHGDCLWVGDTNTGTCMTRHMNDCNDWAKNNTDCTSTKIIPHPATPDFSRESPACPHIRYNFEGHGRGEQDLVARVMVCINDHPLCTDFDFDDTGCSVFDDIPTARDAVDDIAETLGGETCVTISSNQCGAGNGHQNRYSFTVTENGICDETAGPCSPGEYCAYDGDDALCSTGSGLTLQVCCDNKWKVGVLSC